LRRLQLTILSMHPSAVGLPRGMPLRVGPFPKHTIIGWLPAKAVGPSPQLPPTEATYLPLR
jgi:hypothetical protein